jgi:hypothetical protein
MKTARFASYGRGIWDFRIESPLSAQTIANNELSVYPNPARENFSIRGIDAGESALVSVYGLDGKLQFQRQVTGSETISLPKNVVPGLYIVILNRKGKRAVSTKLIVR